MSPCFPCYICQDDFLLSLPLEKTKAISDLIVMVHVLNEAVNLRLVFVFLQSWQIVCRFIIFYYLSREMYVVGAIVHKSLKMSRQIKNKLLSWRFIAIRSHFCKDDRVSKVVNWHVTSNGKFGTKKCLNAAFGQKKQ